MSQDNAISTSIPRMCRLKNIMREKVMLKWLNGGYKKGGFGRYRVPREREREREGERERAAFLFNSLLQNIK